MHNRCVSCIRKFRVVLNSESRTNRANLKIRRWPIQVSTLFPASEKILEIGWDSFGKGWRPAGGLDIKDALVALRKLARLLSRRWGQHRSVRLSASLQKEAGTTRCVTTSPSPNQETRL